jgi:hypothetical protein
MGSGISSDSVDLIHPLCPNISDNKNDSETISNLTIPNSIQPSHSDIDCIHTDPSVSTLSVDALDVSISEAGIHPSCTISIQPKDVSMAIEETHTDLMLASLPISTQDIHPSSSLPSAVQSLRTDESTNRSPNMMPNFLPQNLPFLNVERICHNHIQDL